MGGFFSLCSPMLQSIYITKMMWSDRLLLAIGARCPNLVHVYFSSLAKVTDVGLCALAKGCPKMLLFSWPGSKFITDVGVSAIARNGKLTTLSLVDLPNVTDATISIVTQCCCALTSIHIQNCSNISAGSVISLVFHLYNLRDFSLKMLPLINDKAMQELAKYHFQIAFHSTEQLTKYH